MRPVEVGLVLPLYQPPQRGPMPSWQDIRAHAALAEDLGYDTVWIPDELLWDVESWGGNHGWWECVAIAGAVAASTERIGIGTWVLSALHRNPGLTAKAVATIDEISGGRFLFGLGSGHSAAQGAAFGYPPDHVVGRYEEALQIMVPLLRDGEVDFAGRFHRAQDLEQLPAGPRPGAIPLMLGGHGARTVGLAVRHADIWSGYATASSEPEAFADLFTLVDRSCEEQGRDPATLGRSIGVVVDFVGDGSAGEQAGLGVTMAGTDRIADAIHTLASMGATRVEFMVFPPSTDAFERSASVLELLDG